MPQPQPLTIEELKGKIQILKDKWNLLPTGEIQESMLNNLNNSIKYFNKNLDENEKINELSSLDMIKPKHVPQVNTQKPTGGRRKSRRMKKSRRRMKKSRRRVRM